LAQAHAFLNSVFGSTSVTRANVTLIPNFFKTLLVALGLACVIQNLFHVKGGFHLITIILLICPQGGIGTAQIGFF
jgi:hypothetical protein